MTQSEYAPSCDERRHFISGFTGSAGTAVVTTDAAALWTDGRYFLQVITSNPPACLPILPSINCTINVCCHFCFRAECAHLKLVQVISWLHGRSVSFCCLLLPCPALPCPAPPCPAILDVTVSLSSRGSLYSRAAQALPSCVQASCWCIHRHATIPSKTFICHHNNRCLRAYRTTLACPDSKRAVTQPQRADVPSCLTHKQCLQPTQTLWCMCFTSVSAYCVCHEYTIVG